MEKPEALFLADELEAPLGTVIGAELYRRAAKELRRLHASCEDYAQHKQRQDQRVLELKAQRDAMQERAEYWKRKHDDEETGAERYALRAQRDALLEALKAIEPILARMYGPQAADLPPMQIVRAALAQQAEPKGGGRLPPPLQAEPVQEPVSGVVLNDEGRAALVEHGAEDWHCALRNARRLYTAPPQRKPLSLTDLQEALVLTNLIDRDAIEDPEEYDEGSTMAQIDELHRIIKGGV